MTSIIQATKPKKVKVGEISLEHINPDSKEFFKNQFNYIVETKVQHVLNNLYKAWKFRHTTLFFKACNSLASLAEKPDIDITNLIQQTCQEVISKQLEQFRQTPSQGVKIQDTQKSTESFTQNGQSNNTSLMNFGGITLPKFTDGDSRRFRPLITITDDSQRCLLDNVWHLQTDPKATKYKIAIANALAYYFSKI